MPCGQVLYAPSGNGFTLGASSTAPNISAPPSARRPASAWRFALPGPRAKPLYNEIGARGHRAPQDLRGRDRLISKIASRA